jgi:hypothetical protein
MERLRVVAPCGDRAPAEEAAEPVRVAGADNVEVPDRLALGQGRRQEQIADPRQVLLVEASGRLPLLVPGVQQRELSQEGDRLDRVEARGEPTASCTYRRRCPCSRSARMRAASSRLFVTTAPASPNAPRFFEG